MLTENPEILSPGGDFNSAIHALENGADAVYIGLKNFSARKSAKNFTIDEVRSLKNYCVNNNKKVYIAINTLIKDEEIKDLISLISRLNRIAVDGIIIQDLGLSSLIKELCDIPIHASTQLAVHNIHGVETMKNLGFSRVVLSRELSLKEIKDIQREFPDMELEIFIHGALCYGFSGLCLASGKLLNRSANRGSCGQICRTWFSSDNKKEFSLSLNDLYLGDEILKLKKLGITSLKIEGRMKGPSYAALTAKLYKTILDSERFNTLEESSKVEFNRSGHTGYFNEAEGGANINKNYPGHMGIKIGRVISVSQNSFKAKLYKKVENRDGLMIFDNSSPIKGVKFAAQIVKRDGDIVTFKGKVPKENLKDIYKVSSHKKHLKEEKPQKYKPYKSELKLSIELLKDNIKISYKDLTESYPINLEPAQKSADILDLFNRSFYPGGDTPYHFTCNVVNNSSIESPFIPVSFLKKIRNNFQQIVVEFLNSKESNLNIETNDSLKKKNYLKNRDRLPFITNFENLNFDNLLKNQEAYLLPLTPVIFDSKDYLNRLKTFLNNNKDKNFLIGINNVAHISFIEKIGEGYNYYGDYGLYCCNSYSRTLYSRLIPGLKWVTNWVEEDRSSDSPPLFISRTCLVSKKSGCSSKCKKDISLTLSQNSNRYKVIIKDCLTYIFIDE